MNKPLVVEEVWSWATGGLNHRCQDVGGVSIWFILNTLKDSIEILAGEFVAVSNEEGIVGLREVARLNSNFIQ